MLLRAPRPVLFAIAAGMVIAIGVVVAVILRPATGEPIPSSTPSPTASPSPTPSPSPTATPSRSPIPSPTASPQGLCPITGLPMAAALDADRVGIVVQVDNDPHARPQAGLSSADLIVEATVQGNVTRFGALFYCNDPGVAVGPIRSARFYNLDLWQQIGSLTIGFGGAPYTLDHFISGGMPYLNGNDGWSYFFRSFERIAPYNVYSDLGVIRTDLAAGALEQFNIGIDELRPPFTVDPAAQVHAGRSVGRMDIATNGYWQYSFTFEPDAAGYSRADGSQVMIDAASGQPVVVRTVVVQRVHQDVLYGIDSGVGGDPILHTLAGSGAGTGTVYVDGMALDVAWSRPDAGSTTTWTYADSGEPVVLPPGPIWWQILPDSAAITES